MGVGSDHIPYRQRKMLWKEQIMLSKQPVQDGLQTHVSAAKLTVVGPPEELTSLHGGSQLPGEEGGSRVLSNQHTSVWAPHPATELAQLTRLADTASAPASAETPSEHPLVRTIEKYKKEKGTNRKPFFCSVETSINLLPFIKRRA